MNKRTDMPPASADPLEGIRWVKGWNKASVNGHEVPRLLERIRALPDWTRGQFTEVPLDIQPLRETRNRWYRMKTGPFRVFFLAEGDEVVIGEIDRRDDHTYKDIQRLDSIVVVRRGRGIEFVEVVPALDGSGKGRALPGRAKSTARLSAVENPISALSDAQLVQLGSSKHLVTALRTMAPSINLAAELASRGVEPRVLEMLAAAWADPERVQALFAEGRTPTLDDLALSPSEIGTRLASRDSDVGLAMLDAQTFEAALAGSMPDWMMFLHPAQRGIVEAEPTGPMSLRGGPGTGKTVVALHRARWLLSQEGFDRVLVTTFVKSLPSAWAELMRRLIPDASDRGQVTARTVDSLVMGIGRDAGLPKVAVLNGKERTRLAGDVLDRYPNAKGALGDASAFEEEIDIVIAGRGLDRDGYMAAARSGRRRPLGASQRMHVWAAYEAYRDELDVRGAPDWAHARIRALQLANEGFGPRFDAIIVDEAQDLSEVQLRLLRALDADPQHKGFMVVGDAGQAIYPGGSRLRGVGLDVRGRSYVLRDTWRNTQFISAAADAVLGDAARAEVAADYDRAGARSGAPIAPQRVGDPATLYVTSTFDDADVVLRIVVEEFLAYLSPGDVAVLAPTRNHVDIAARALDGLPTVPLAEVAGLPPRDRVSIATFHRAKGLEFKAVVVTDAERNFLKINEHPDGARDDRREERDLYVRTLYVAMTRARDALALIAHGPLPQQLLDASSIIDIREV